MKIKITIHNGRITVTDTRNLIEKLIDLFKSDPQPEPQETWEEREERIDRNIQGGKDVLAAYWKKEEAWRRADDNGKALLDPQRFAKLLEERAEEWARFESYINTWDNWLLEFVHKEGKYKGSYSRKRFDSYKELCEQIESITGHSEDHPKMKSRISDLFELWKAGKMPNPITVSTQWWKDDDTNN